MGGIKDRGFASMDTDKHRELARKGGLAAQRKGTAHRWTSEEAMRAGRKGGMTSARRRRTAGADIQDPALPLEADIASTYLSGIPDGRHEDSDRAK
jgi:uncharacterized protein